jgi:hypothetical protein
VSEVRRQLFTIGTFFIILVVAIVLLASGAIDWKLIVPVVLVLFGAWILMLAVIRKSNPQKYERGTFSTLSLGMLLVAVGGAWYIATFNWLYSVALILLVFGALAIAAALKRK